LIAFNKRGFQSFYEEMQARQAQQEKQKEIIRKQEQDKDVRVQNVFLLDQCLISPLNAAPKFTRAHAKEANGLKGRRETKKRNNSREAGFQSNSS
jgi:hypothetical protein